MMDSGDRKSKLPPPLEFGNLWFEGHTYIIIIIIIIIIKIIK